MPWATGADERRYPSMDVQPVILAGGSGTRLWPLSRAFHPKQILSLRGDGLSLLQATVRRCTALAPDVPPWVVTGEEHRFLVKEQVEALGAEPLILLEPEGRNTAPAAALAACWAREAGRDPVMIVSPSDHLITKEEAFLEVLERHAVPLAAEGALVVLGMEPKGPETGFGYIKKGEGFKAERFTEKPDLETAEAYLREGGYYWNAGIFVMAASAYLQELARLAPDILEPVERAVRGARRDGPFLRVEPEAFLEARSESIDYAVMERSNKVMVVPAEIGWSDVGSWKALWEEGEKDACGNVVSGDAVLVDAEGSLVHSSGRVVGAVGVKDLIIVETKDAVLVAHRERAQDVKAVVERLKREGREEALIHPRVYRPWGHYETIDRAERFQVKRITVKPGASLSLQMHHHRAEHWIVVKGTARIVKGDEEILLTENESTYIPVGEKHRLENPGKIPLELIEVQSGSYLGEDDIVRFEDEFGRAED